MLYLSQGAVAIVVVVDIRDDERRKMKVSLLSLAAMLGVTTAFSPSSSVVNTRPTTSATAVQMSSPAVDAAPFAKPPR